MRSCIFQGLVVPDQGILQTQILHGTEWYFLTDGGKEGTAIFWWYSLLAQQLMAPKQEFLQATVAALDALLAVLKFCSQLATHDGEHR